MGGTLPGASRHTGPELGQTQRKILRYFMQWDHSMHHCSSLIYLIRADSLEDYNTRLIHSAGRWTREYNTY
jgi:hypothetical protein